MATLPISETDITAARALRAEFARFWSTEQGDPRTIYDRFTAATPVAEDVDVEEADDMPGPGLWVRPRPAALGRAVLFLHGGGYGLGSASAYTGMASQLAARMAVPAFVLNYPLAPEAQLPAALEMALATLRRLTADGCHVAVVGDSAGGGLTLATVQAAGEAGVPVAAAAVFSPWTDLSLSGASVARNAVADPLLDVDYLRASARAYLGSVPARDPSASPLFGPMSGLPPLMIQVGTDEILLDDSVRFAGAVEKNGGTVELEVWQGMHHVFQLNVTQLAAARSALDNAARFLCRHFG